MSITAARTLGDASISTKRSSGKICVGQAAAPFLATWRTTDRWQDSLIVPSYQARMRRQLDDCKRRKRKSPTHRSLSFLAGFVLPSAGQVCAEFVGADRTNPMGEAGVGMVADKALNLVPIALVIADLLALGANRQQAAERLDLDQCVI